MAKRLISKIKQEPQDADLFKYSEPATYSHNAADETPVSARKRLIVTDLDEDSSSEKSLKYSDTLTVSESPVEIPAPLVKDSLPKIAPVSSNSLLKI